MTQVPGSVIPPARQEGDHGAPPEPPHDAGQELLLGAAAHGGFGLGEEGDLREIEVVEEADPGNAGQEVNPPQQEQVA
jgi:hypothetical protein